MDALFIQSGPISDKNMSLLSTGALIFKDAVKSVLRILSAHNKVCCWGPTHWNFNLIKQAKFRHEQLSLAVFK